MSYLQYSPSSFFSSYESLKSRKRRIFFSDELHTRARTWKPLSPPGLVCRQKKGGREKEKKKKEKKRRRPRKVVYRHKKGTGERRKEKDQGRQELGSAKARFRVPSNKNFFFWFTSIWVWKWPISFEVLAPTRLSLRGSHVQRKFRKQTTLRSESNTLNGLLHAG